MNKLTMGLSVILLTSMLTACADSNNNDTPANNQQNTQNNTNESNEKNNSDNQHSHATDDKDKVATQMSDINIKEIEIEIEYSDDQEYEAEIELHSDGTYTSELEDELTNTYLKGQEAFDHIYPMVAKLNLDEESTKEEVFNQVLTAFDLDDQYKEIEVEITFYDSEIELEFEEQNK